MRLVKAGNDFFETLVDIFAVTKQTILNDIVFLSSRVPITTNAGNGGGIFLDLVYDYPKVYLTEDEERLLLNLCGLLCEKDRKWMTNTINKFFISTAK